MEQRQWVRQQEDGMVRWIREEKQYEIGNKRDETLSGTQRKESMVE